MTDRELLELAAKAAGIEVSFDRARRDWAWNPLDDDGTALRLAVKLDIDIAPGFETNRFACAIGEAGQILEERRPCEYAATRRAIVRAAAVIGEQMT